MSRLLHSNFCSSGRVNSSHFAYITKGNALLECFTFDKLLLGSQAIIIRDTGFLSERKDFHLVMILGVRTVYRNGEV